MKKFPIVLLGLLLSYTTGAQCSFTLSSSVTDASCADVCDGDATVVITGGVGPFLISWDDSTSQTTATAINLCPGTYMVTVTDSNDMCSSSINVTVSNPPQPSFNPVAYDASCAMNDGLIVCNISGPSFPYTFSLSPNAGTYNTGQFQNLPPGSYVVTETDVNGCSISVPLNINISNNLTVSATGTNATCGICDGTASVSVSGGAGGYTYSWSGPSGYTSSVQNPSGLCAGVYFLTVSSGGCSANTSVVINNAGASTVSTMPTPSSCTGCTGTLQITVTGGTPPYQYSIDGGVTFSGSNFYGGLCTGPYNVMVIDASGCNTFSPVFIPTSNINGLTVTDSIFGESAGGLNNGAILLDLSGATGPFNFSWSNGASTQSVYNLAAGTYSVTIIDGAGNCNSYSYVVPVLSTYQLEVITGSVVIDANSNCALDSADLPVNGVLVSGNGMYSAFVNNGSYSLYVPQGTYTVTHTPPPFLSATCNTNYPNVNSNTGNINFYDSLTNTDVDMSVSLNTFAITPGFNGVYNLFISNDLVLSASGTVCLELPDSLTYINANPAPASVNGNTICFTYSGLGYLQSESYQVMFSVPANPALLGTVMTACATVTANEAESNLVNNVYCYDRVVTGSYDPNDKTVSPAGEGSDGEILLDEEYFSYLIRFQNTGNGPAVNIVVMDTLSGFLDLSTLEMLSASHTYELIILPGNILRWKFENIMLPDSNSNEPGSHGYIHFRMKRTNTVQPGDKIENTAAIYFDFNPPVITNTAVNTFVEPDAIEESYAKNNFSLLLFPNPATDELNFRVDDWNGNKMDITVSDITGRDIYNSTVDRNNGTIGLSSFENGLYFIRLQNGNSSVVKPFVIRK